ncbi:MAG TPA: FKBP-type peptidyl-prolyl cis-trans isomerase [Fulvivirga sp.]|nr:FKBP-type peptidyl-prolyl cis-trans isomerase [Fulvivirga sp.]
MRKIINTVLIVSVGVLLFGCIDSDQKVDPTIEQLNKDVAIIDAYLKQNSITAIADPSGIRYVVHNQGSGLKAYFADSLTLTYSIEVLSTGVEVENVESEKKKVNNILSGVNFAASKIQEGGSMTVYIPSFYGYGATAKTDVPPNSVLIAEVTFEKLHHLQLLKDIAIIDDSLVSWGIETLVHPSGIRYTLVQGNGAQPTSQSIITMNYSGTRLNGAVFDSRESETFTLSGLILGWQVMIPEMKVGGKMTMYLPSTFGYGVAGARNIPPNAILIFDVELLNTN